MTKAVLGYLRVICEPHPCPLRSPGCPWCSLSRVARGRHGGTALDRLSDALYACERSSNLHER